MTENEIKCKIAYELSQRQERAGHATTPEYNWVRACRIFDHYTNPETDEVYYKRNCEEYAEWARFFMDRCADGTRIESDPLKTPSRFKEDSASG